MKLNQIKLIVVFLVVILKFSYPTLGQSPVNCPYLYNATQRFEKPGKVLGVRGQISFTSPDLNTGEFSFHRVAVSNASTNISTFHFFEVGWDKSYTNLLTLHWVWIAFGTLRYDYLPISSQQAHNATYVAKANMNFINGTIGNRAYIVRLEPQDGLSQPLEINIYNIDLGVGDWALAGGETCFGSEDMNNIQYFNLDYRKTNNASGGLVWKEWNGYIPHRVDSPYYNVSNGLRAFFSKRHPIFPRSDIQNSTELIPLPFLEKK